jgi:hypothetical protein
LSASTKLRLVASAPYRAMLVPDTAIATDAARRVLFVVDQKGVVAARPVELGPLVGSLRVIRSGIGPRDRVVIDGLQRAVPGQKVDPKPGTIRANGGPEPTAQRPAAVPSSVATPVAR